MKTKFGINYLILPIIFSLFLLLPEHIVWGGQSFQTVPTIGPSPTPTRTLSFSATQPASTTTPSNNPTSPSVLISPVASTSTFTPEATQESHSATSETQKTESTSVTDESSKPESTSVVVLPVVSNGDSAPDDQSNQDRNKPIPAFVFPLVVVLLFVTIYLSTRWSLKKSQVEKSTQNNQ